MPAFTSGTATIPVEVFEPAGVGPFPAVVIAYGTEGMNPPFGPDIRAFAADLVGSGNLVLIPYYFARTGTDAGPAAVEAFMVHRNAWLAALEDTLTYAVTRSGVDADRLGLCGFSMGGHLALRLAKSDGGAAVKAMVEFFAPISMFPFRGIGDDLTRLPRLQIHHGEEDKLVLPGETHELLALLTAAGKIENTDFEKYFYPGEEHGFRGAAAIRDSKQRTADFFARHLA